MAMRFRKSFQVAPGVRLNVGKKSTGVTLGGKYFRQSFNTSGRRTSSSSIPGTGISFYETSTKKKKKSKKAERKVRMEEEVNREPETVVDDVIDLPSDTVIPEEPEPHKPKLWLWAVMALVLVAGLWYMLGSGSNTPDVASGTPADSTVTTTQFSYSADDVELKMMNGALTAFVGDKQVPFNGLVNAADGTYVVENGVANTGYNGVYESDGTVRLVKDGKIDTTLNGVITANGGQRYNVSGGKASVVTTTRAATTSYSNSGSSSGGSSYSHSGTYIASYKSKPKKFHRVNGCGGARQIKKENAVYFDSYQEAIDANYAPCKNCF